MKKETFNIFLTPSAKALIQAMAKEEGASSSAMIERLIRTEAKRRKLPVPKPKEGT